ncbi:hypothetical protein KIPB_013768, partial [Kipferlia bialata]|eukprot:g13768.t1
MGSVKTKHEKKALQQETRKMKKRRRDAEGIQKQMKEASGAQTAIDRQKAISQAISHCFTLFS